MPTNKQKFVCAECDKEYIDSPYRINTKRYCKVCFNSMSFDKVVRLIEENKQK